MLKMDERHKKKKRKKRVRWSLDAELLLIALWGEKIADLRGPRKNFQVYIEIEEEMQERRYDFSASEIREKIHNLSSKYKLERKETGTSSWIHYQAIHELFEGDNMMDLSQMKQENAHRINGSTASVKQINERLPILDDSNYFERNVNPNHGESLEDFQPETEFVGLGSPFEKFEGEHQSMSSTESSAPTMSKRLRKSAASKAIIHESTESNKIRDQNQSEKFKFLSDLMKTATEAQPPDHIDLFLQSVGQTIRTFSEVEISEVKLEILKIILEKQQTKSLPLV